MVEFVESSVLDLVRATEFLHHIKPEYKQKMVCGIEKIRPMDQSVVFHLMDRGTENQGLKETQIFMLAADYIIQHPIWKKLEKGSTND